MDAIQGCFPASLESLGGLLLQQPISFPPMLCHASRTTE